MQQASRGTACEFAAAGDDPRIILKPPPGSCAACAGVSGQRPKRSRAAYHEPARSDSMIGAGGLYAACSAGEEGEKRRKVHHTGHPAGPPRPRRL
ncbi:hypothetical protein RM96_13750 [Cupriavidus sp. IDO]|nr:hypothetical protein RM96_13750 [Cupriavidus sp. IDO]